MFNIFDFNYCSSCLGSNSNLSPSFVYTVICNVAAIAFGKFDLPNPGVGTALLMPEMFLGVGMG